MRLIITLTSERVRAFKGGIPLMDESPSLALQSSDSRPVCMGSKAEQLAAQKPWMFSICHPMNGDFDDLIADLLICSAREAAHLTADRASEVWIVLPKNACKPETLKKAVSSLKSIFRKYGEVRFSCPETIPEEPGKEESLSIFSDNEVTVREDSHETTATVIVLGLTVIVLAILSINWKLILAIIETACLVFYTIKMAVLVHRANKDGVCCLPGINVSCGTWAVLLASIVALMLTVVLPSLRPVAGIVFMIDLFVAFMVQDEWQCNLENEVRHEHFLKLLKNEEE